MKTTVEKLKEQSINIKDICDSFAINYKVATNRDLLIKSPANTQQKTESLRVRADYKGSYNYFKDFANDEIGDILNFTKYMFNASTAEASKLLQDKFLLNTNTAEMQVKKREQIQSETVQQSKKRKVEILEKKEISNTALTDYLVNVRKIDLHTAHLANIKEIRYKNERGTFFALAFENEKKGFEIRNKLFKGSLNMKSITTFANEKSPEVNVFEGFLDYASAIILSKKAILQQNNIVLNSTSLVDDSIEKIKELNNIKKIKLYLDNDKAGKDAASKFNTAFKDVIEVEDHSNKYDDDLNQHLVKKVKNNTADLSR